MRGFEIWDSDEFGYAIWREMNKHGWTQQELAKKLKMSQSGLNQLINNKRTSITKANIKNIEKTFNIEIKLCIVR